MIALTNVVKEFKGDDGPVKALDGITVHIEQSEKFGIIGESGSGKSHCSV